MVVILTATVCSYTIRWFSLSHTDKHMFTIPAKIGMIGIVVGEGIPHLNELWATSQLALVWNFSSMHIHQCIYSLVCLRMYLPNNVL